MNTRHESLSACIHIIFSAFLWFARHHIFWVCFPLLTDSRFLWISRWVAYGVPTSSPLASLSPWDRGCLTTEEYLGNKDEMCFHRHSWLQCLILWSFSQLIGICTGKEHQVGCKFRHDWNINHLFTEKYLQYFLTWERNNETCILGGFMGKFYSKHLQSMQKLFTHQVLKKARNETKPRRDWSWAGQKSPPNSFPLENARS